MGDDICGASTTGTEPCQNPTVEDGDAERCWIPSHNDPGAENPQGRDFVLDADDHDDILTAARDGLSKSGCARAAGTGPDQLNRYLDAHPDFREAFERARAQGETTLIQSGAFGDADPSMAKFLLATSFGYVKTEKREVEHAGDGGGPLEVALRREVVHDDGGD